MFAVVEFVDNGDIGGSLSIVNSQWLTPRKKETFWPPTKDQLTFNKILRKSQQEVNSETWNLFPINKIFYETDNYEKAKVKLRQAEITSDLQSDVEELPKRRRITRPNRFDSDESDESENPENIKTIPKPPPIKKLKLNKEGVCQTSRSLQFSPSFTPADGSSDNLNIISNSKSMLNNGPSNDSTPRTTTDCLTPSAGLADKSAFAILLKNVLQIKEQNKQILSILEQNRSIPGISTCSSSNKNLPEDFPVSLPLTHLEDLNTLEIYLKQAFNIQKLVAHFSSIGGSLRSKTHRILKSILKNELAANFNFCGRNRNKGNVPKRAFSELNICKVIIDSVKWNSDFTIDKIENTVKDWLKYAPTRQIKEKKLV